MEVGMLTVPFKDEPFETVVEFAENASIPCLEIYAPPGSKHIDPNKLGKTRVHEIRDMLDERGIQITALGHYWVDVGDSKKARTTQAQLKKVIDAAELLNVPVVGILPGFPPKGMTPIETIRQVLPKVLKPVLEHARKKGIKIAAENYFMTCLCGLDTFEELFKAVPDENFGLNYDPSHLVHLQCDYMEPVSLYADRIFHTHAKDTLIDHAKLRQVGVRGDGWWRYVIPGFGAVRWGEYIAHLRGIGYDGVLSIEHEDDSQTREEGFMRGALYLEQFC